MLSSRLLIRSLPNLFGSLLDLPGWVSGISPFEHLPLVPVEDLAWLPLGALTLLGAALLAIGLVGFRSRDISA